MATIKSASDIAASMIQALGVSEPELDTAIGSPTRKIIDAVAEQVAPAYATSHLLDYQFSIDSKDGADLDSFCELFGIYRFAARRATGVVTFTRPAVADRNYAIPARSQVTTRTRPRVIFVTVAPAILLRGTTSVDVPVRALLGGESGNLPTGSLSTVVSGSTGVQSATVQSDPTSGGTSIESDASLRARFKKTVFRSLAGTEDMFLALALEDTTTDNANDTVASQANVIGASKRWREQVQVSAGTATSTIPVVNAKYIYSGSVFFGPDIDNGEILTEGIHYSFDSSIRPPVIHSLGSGLINGELYDLDFQYTPVASRNEPLNGVFNRVDIWVSGQFSEKAAETSYFVTLAFNTTTDSQMYRNLFVRQNTANVRPVTGNLFLPLAFGPIVTFPNSLTIAGATYTKGTDYWVVHEDNAFGYGPSSRFGLEWLASSHPTDGQQIVLSGNDGYFYNRLPGDVENRARTWRMVTQDVRAHAAKRVYLRMNFAIMYSDSGDRTLVRRSIQNALATYMSNQGFNSVLQVSDILAVVHNVTGVDNIRFLNSTEPNNTDNYGIERTTSTGTRMSYLTDGGTPDRARDVILAENEVPVLYAVTLRVRAQNTFAESSS